MDWYHNGISSPSHILVIDSLIHGRLDVFWDSVLHLVLPVVTLTYAIMAGILRDQV